MRKDLDELLKASADFETEQDKKMERLVKALREDEATITDQRGELEVARTYTKETEAINAKSWELMNQFHDFLTSLGVVSLDPTHESGDGLASIRWMSFGLASAKTASIQWGHHCARVA